MRFKAKLKKLCRNPKLFVKDSKLCRNFIKREQVVFDDTIEDIKIKPVLKEINYLQFTTNGNIILPDIGIDQNSYLKTLILYSSDYLSLASEIINFCYEHEDFKPLRKNELIVYQYESFQEVNSYSDIVQMIDAKNKEKLAGYLNIIVIDENPVLAQALRCCHPDICVTLITNNENNLIHLIDFKLLDYCIIYSDSPTDINHNVGRNIYHTGKIKNIALYVRKVIQNTLRREIDLFIPIISDTEYKPELISLSNHSSSIFVKVSEMPIVAVKNHSDLCRMFVDYMTELFVKETVYLKYQDVLEESSKENLIAFFLLATRDGMKIEVEYE
ncbi:hypothetical protein J7552_06490 [Wohlfahrtiimonas chitiniclastica]|uniref:hypothetical protein n=1 Tax=Wohlfahrtiimonas chitiniclastica TaxID=400946 RepID=UPI001BCABA03|nr:hypothetical protein [Wohlfahrtiimonas chitiniclastica]MBS7820933.1 hypothetical protein [Wohlfahrtiimonas chitiniclastica]